MLNHYGRCRAFMLSTFIQRTPSSLGLSTVHRPSCQHNRPSPTSCWLLLLACLRRFLHLHIYFVGAVFFNNILPSPLPLSLSVARSQNQTHASVFVRRTHGRDTRGASLSAPPHTLTTSLLRHSLLPVGDDVDDGDMVMVLYSEMRLHIQYIVVYMLVNIYVYVYCICI